MVAEEVAYCNSFPFVLRIFYYLLFLTLAWKYDYDSRSVVLVKLGYFIANSSDGFWKIEKFRRVVVLS